MRAKRLSWLLAVTALIAAVGAGCGSEDGGIAGVSLAEIRVTPTTVAFDEIGVGESQVRTIVVENLGGSELIISEFNWSGETRDLRAEGLSSLRVDAGSAGSFDIVYEPTDGVTDNGQLVIESNGGTAIVDITGQGTVANLRTDPEQVQLFSDTVGVPVGQLVTVYNTGSEAFTISGLQLITGSTEFRMRAENFSPPVNVGPDDEVQIQITYAPGGPGTDEADLLIEHNAGNANGGATLIPVQGSLRSAQISVDPDFIGFGSVPLDTTETVVATVSNIGVVDLRISDVYLTNSTSDDFALVSVNDVSYTPGDVDEIVLGPEESTTIEVAYTPTDGVGDSGTVVFVSNDIDFPQFRVDMGGTVAGPRLTVSRAQVEFGSVAQTLSSDRTLIVSNTGDATLELDDFVLDNGAGAFSIPNGNVFPESLEPSQAVELIVRYTPQVEGGVLGSITFTAPNDPFNSPKVVDLAGFGAGTPYCRLTVL
ncbi:MAG: choice-of-anchor D domain-containing protein, partial [Myxococcales bacterium]|nr:choice-of-anchor D domain-containing protein [Myxococcales bacterium]